MNRGDHIIEAAIDFLNSEAEHVEPKFGHVRIARRITPWVVKRAVYFDHKR